MGQNLLCANKCTKKCGIQIKLAEEKSILDEGKTIEEQMLDISCATEPYQLD